MHNINLLPQKQKQKRLALSVVTYITFGFIILLISIVGLAVTLTTIRVTINERTNNYIGTREGIEVKIKAFQTIEKEVTETNKALGQAVKILDRQLLPASIFKIISGRVSDKITLTSISIAKPTSPATKTDTATIAPQITLLGSAKQRTDIIDFKRGLESTGAFESVVYTIGTSAAAGSSTTPTTPASISGEMTFTINAQNKAVQKQ